MTIGMIRPGRVINVRLPDELFRRLTAERTRREGQDPGQLVSITAIVKEAIGQYLDASERTSEIFLTFSADQFDRLTSKRVQEKISLRDLVYKALDEYLGDK